MTFKNRIAASLAAALTISVVAGLGAPSAHAQKDKKQGNKLTWRKVGKDIAQGTRDAGKQIGHGVGKAGRATEYGVRKGGEEVSVATHRATGKNSVVRDRGKKQDYLVRPDGTRVPIKSRAQADRLSGKKSGVKP